MLESRHARWFTYCNLRYKWTPAPDAAVVRCIRRSNLIWRLTAVRRLTPLAAVERMAMIEGRRGNGDVWIVAASIGAAVIVKCFVFVIRGGWPLMMAV